MIIHTSDLVTISSIDPIYKIEVVSSSGTSIMEVNVDFRVSFAMSLDYLASGVYRIQVYTVNTVHSRPLMVVK